MGKVWKFFEKNSLKKMWKKQQGKSVENIWKKCEKKFVEKMGEKCGNKVWGKSKKPKSKKNGKNSHGNFLEKNVQKIGVDKNVDK